MRERETSSELPYFDLDYTKLTDKNGMGVVPAIILEPGAKPPRMVGFMNKEAFERSRELKQAVFWQRSKSGLWLKGETSGNVLNIENWTADCDTDTLVVFAKPVGPTCHRGTETCFD